MAKSIINRRASKKVRTCFRNNRVINHIMDSERKIRNSKQDSQIKGGNANE